MVSYMLAIYINLYGIYVNNYDIIVISDSGEMNVALYIVHVY